MQPPFDHTAAARKESRLLIGIAAGLGCLLVLCLVIAGVAGLLAGLWTLQGTLGPGGGSLAPAAGALLF
jgi:hypothetical protein